MGAEINCINFRNLTTWRSLDNKLDLFSSESTKIGNKLLIWSGLECREHHHGVVSTEPEWIRYGWENSCRKSMSKLRKLMIKVKCQIKFNEVYRFSTYQHSPRAAAFHLQWCQSQPRALDSAFFFFLRTEHVTHLIVN